MNNLVQFLNKNTNTRVKLETKRIPNYISKLENIVKTEEKKLNTKLLTISSYKIEEKNKFNDNVLLIIMNLSYRKN